MDSKPEDQVWFISLHDLQVCMNTRITQWDIPRTPQNTNLEGGRGRGCSPSLGRKTFINELISRSNSSIGAQNQGPSSLRRCLVSPRMETSVSMVETTIGDVTPSSVPVE